VTAPYSPVPDLRRRPLAGGLLSVLFVIATAGWLFVLMVCAAIVAGILLGPDAPPEAMDTLIWDPWFLGPVTTLQMLGFAGLVALFTRVGDRDPAATRPLAPPAAGAALAALVVGVAVGGPTSWIAEWLNGRWIFSDAGLVGVAGALLEGAVLPRVLLALSVVVLAPLVEELIFRGLLWDALGDHLPPLGVWLLTSALFGAYHLDPLHAVAVFPIGLLLGWLRWRTGSLVAPILGHAANNLVALIGIFAVGVEAEPSVAWGIGGGVLVLLATGGLLLTGPPKDPSDAR